MDVEPILGVPTLLKDVQDSIKVVHSALHSCPAVDIDYGLPSSVGNQEFSEVIIVDLARLQRLDLHMAER